ncbi:carboxypeptidase-like regulatory domain-containing protein [Runella aurantiaca]|nr:carboxypeptidase-like regulatory domain-containing protein [Runella aurantiaca]
MKTLLYAALALLSSCIPPHAHVHPDSDSPQKGIVSGRVVDTSGKPLANADIVVNNAQFYNNNILGKTDANGHYSLSVNAGSWYVRGTVTVRFDNKTYVLDLFPETTGAFAGSEGAIRNLRWKLTGEKPKEFGMSGHYGGSLDVYGAIGEFFDTDNVEFTFKPVGTLIDGSAGKTLTVKTGDENAQDIPLGKYTVTARYLPTNQSMLLRQRNASQSYKNSVTASFEPTYPGATGSYQLTLEVKLP